VKGNEQLSHIKHDNNHLSPVPPQQSHTGLDGVAWLGRLEVRGCHGVLGGVCAVMAVASWSRVWMLSLR
jgi:hypothetical protein